MKKLFCLIGGEKRLARTAQVRSVEVDWGFGMSEVVGGSTGRERALAGVGAVGWKTWRGELDSQRTNVLLKMKGRLRQQKSPRRGFHVRRRKL